jgi:3-hydroxyisobutyrate dehydrogenase-like beta-hydroxyacid dehydrogenase
MTELGAAAAARGVVVIDAPVSGGRAVAEQGQMLVITGGDAAAAERCRPVFATFSKAIVHIGPLGSGAIAKAINNMVLAANVTMALDVFEFAEELGLEKAGLSEVLINGTGATAAMGIVAGSGFSWPFMLEHSSPYFRKDLDLMREIAAAAGVRTPTALDQLAERVAKGLDGGG